jgi:hypothetical protein
MARLYTDFFARRFVANGCSWIFLFTLILWACILFLPAVFSQSTYDLWKRVDFLYLSPNVNYIGEFYAIANVGGTVKEYSTVPKISANIETQLDSPTLTVNKVIPNNDYTPETINLSFSFSKAAAESVNSLTLITNLDYHLNETVNTRFKTLVYIPVEAPPSASTGIGSVSLTGVLDLQ